MAHDFIVAWLDDEERVKARADFYGYAEAVFYKAFDAESFDAGISGSGESKIITQEEAKDGLLFALNSDAITNYPDPNRIDAVRNFYEEYVKNADSSEKFVVWFG